MSRWSLNHYKTSLRGGVNENAETATSEQCSDARNVWAPDGKVVGRPGYEGIRSLVVAGTTSSTAGQSSSTATGISVGDYIYLGWTTDLYSANALGVTATTTNTVGTCQFKAEYWNGTSWQHLRLQEFMRNLSTGNTVDPTLTGAHGLFDGTSLNRLIFVPPADWAQTSVSISGTPTTRYWLRFKVLNAATGTVSLGTFSYLHGQTWGAEELLAVVDSAIGKTVFSCFQNGTRLVVDWVPDILAHGWKARPASTTTARACTAQLLVDATQPVTLAFVPETQDVFVCARKTAQFYLGDVKDSSSSLAFQQVFLTDGYTSSNGDTGVAQVDNSDAATGPGAPYDKDEVSLRTSFPEGDFVVYFAKRLWIIDANGRKVSWSAPVPYHRVWPHVQFEVLPEADTSPITAVAPLGEHLVIYKQDSIWIMVDNGTDEFGLDRFVPIQVVNGVGCIAPRSVATVRGNHIFHAEDGIYSFDGRSVTKLSDRIATALFGQRAQAQRASAVNWRTENCYIITVGSLTFVYDYSEDAWWIWDDIDAVQWVRAEGDTADEEVLYFVNRYGHVFQFGVRNNDHGGTISSYVVTQRLGLLDNIKLRVRSIEVTSTNRSQTVGVECLLNDAAAGETTTLSYTDTLEPTWSDFSYASGASTDDSYVTKRRRARRVSYRGDCDWFQVKLTHSVKDQPFELSLLDVGALTIGRR